MKPTPAMRRPRAALWLATLGLGAALAVQALPWVRGPMATHPPDLHRTIPRDSTGWVSRELELGPSEFLRSAVEKTLNYDDVLYREYARGNERFTVYVAYWQPERMPVQLVASHTPDRCWTENGWHCLDMKFRQRGLFPGAEVPPAEWRVFEPPAGDGRVYAVFWHLVGGEVYDYGERFNAIPDPLRWWSGALRQALHGTGEQYFVRLTSDQPLENLWADRGFRDVVNALAALAHKPAPGRQVAARTGPARALNSARP